jgi:WD40 repeat protein
VTSAALAVAIVQSHGANRLVLAARLLATAEELSHPESADCETAILLALESYRLDPTVRSLDLLFALLDPVARVPAIRVPLASDEAKWRLHPDGSLTILDRGKAQVIECASGRVEGAFDTSGPVVEALSPDGLTVAAVSRTGTLTIWDARSARQIDSRMFSGSLPAAFRALAISNDARVLALLGRDATVHLIQHPRIGMWNDHPLPPPAGYDGAPGHAETYLSEDGSRIALWYYSPFGMRATSCAWQLRDATGKVRSHREYREPNCEDGGVVLSPSGRYLAELANGSLALHGDGARAPHGQNGEAWQVTFSPGESLAAVEEEAAIRVVEIGARPRSRAFREVALRRTADGESVLGVFDALPDRHALLVTRDRNRVAVRDLPSGETVAVVPFPARVLQAALTADRRFLAASTSAALFVEPLDATDRLAWNHDTVAIRDLQITPDGTHALTIGDDNSFRAWDLRSGKRTARASLGEDELGDALKLWSIQQSAGGSFILLQALNKYRESRAFGGPARKMLSRTGALPELPDLDYHQVWFSPQGNWLLAMETGMGNLFADLGLFRFTPNGVAAVDGIDAASDSLPVFSPDAAYFSAATPDGVEVVDTRTQRASILQPANGHDVKLAFSPVGSTLAVVTDDSGYAILDHRTSKIVHSRAGDAHAGRANRWVDEAFFSARGRYLAVVAVPRSYVFEVATGRAAATFETKDTGACSPPDADSVYDIDIAHDGSLELSRDERYAAGCDGGRLVAVNLETGRKSTVPLAGTGAFRVAPPYLAAASGHHVTVFRIDTMMPLARIDHGDTVSGVLFTPGQHQIVTWGGATIRRERCWSGPAEQACGKLTRNLTPQEWGAYFGNLPYRKTCPGLP